VGVEGESGKGGEWRGAKLSLEGDGKVGGRKGGVRELLKGGVWGKGGKRGGEGGGVGGGGGGTDEAGGRIEEEERVVGGVRVGVGAGGKG